MPNGQRHEALLAALKWQMEMGVSDTVDDDGRADSTLAPNTSEPVSRPSVDRNSSQDSRAMATRLGTKTGILPLDEKVAGNPESGEFQARAKADEAKTLAELEQVIRNFDECGLKRTAANTVFADGNPEAPIMMVGEAPGADEDRQGKPFVGPSGKLLDKMMAALGWSRDQDYYISNILPWRPPGNRKPTPVESAMCLPFIRRHIALAKPKILVLLGGTAVSALLETTAGITRVRGRWSEYPLDDCVLSVMPTFHPAYLLRQPQLKAEAWQDLLSIEKKLEELRA